MDHILALLAKHQELHLVVLQAVLLSTKVRLVQFQKHLVALIVHLLNVELSVWAHEVTLVDFEPWVELGVAVKIKPGTAILAIW